MQHADNRLSVDATGALPKQSSEAQQVRDNRRRDGHHKQQLGYTDVDMVDSGARKFLPLSFRCLATVSFI